MRLPISSPRRAARRLGWLAGLALALGACTTATATPPPSTATLTPPPTAPVMPTLPPTATFPPATDTAAPPTATLAPSATVTAALTATLAVSPTAPISATATLAATAIVSATATAAGVDKAEFLADVTLPDGSEVSAGTTITKTWQVRNAGTTTWGPGYELVFVRGESFGAPAAVPLGQTVAPGQTVDLAVPLTAPDALGARTGFWQLRTAAGTLFGVGAAGNEALYVQVVVVPAGATPGPAPTAAPSGPFRVNAASLRVDPAVLTTPCPYTMTFVGVLEVQGAGTVRYQLEAVSQTPGFTFTLPDPIDGIFKGPGPVTFGLAYFLEMRGSVSGTARLVVTAPNAIASEPVSFSLTCQP